MFSFLESLSDFERCVQAMRRQGKRGVLCSKEVDATNRWGPLAFLRPRYGRVR